MNSLSLLGKFVGKFTNVPWMMWLSMAMLMDGLPGISPSHKLPIPFPDSKWLLTPHLEARTFGRGTTRSLRDLLTDYEPWLINHLQVLVFHSSMAGTALESFPEEIWVPKFPRGFGQRLPWRGLQQYGTLWWSGFLFWGKNLGLRPYRVKEKTRNKGLK